MPHLSVLQLALLAVIGVVVGALNAIAGAGSLITFPVLIAFGLSPLVANVSNCIGVTAGNVSATGAFRRELKGQGSVIRRMLLPAAAGSIAGAILLLALPSRLFDFISPVLVGIGSLLTLLQPWLAKRVAARRNQSSHQGDGFAFRVLIFLIALYGGYFGSGIGLLFFAVLNIWLLDRSMHQIDGIKSVLQGLSNGCAGLLFCFAAPVSWPAAIVLLISGLAGGPLGVLLTRRIPAKPLRMGIGVCGLAAAVWMAARTF